MISSFHRSPLGRGQGLCDIDKVGIVRRESMILTFHVPPLSRG